MWKKHLKEQWDKFTWVGKIVLFPLLLVVIIFIRCVEIVFEGMDSAAASFANLMSVIFFKQ